MQTRLLINGQLEAGTGAALGIINPSTGVELITVAEAGAEQVAAAIAAATAPLLAGL